MQMHNGHQASVRAAVAQIDITPPIGIYHRMWGAAQHDRAASIHRPLLATVLWLAPADGSLEESIAIVSLDHCILDNEDVQLFQSAMSESLGIASHHVLICLSHTHAAGLMSRSRADCPGGEGIAPYLDSVAEKLRTVGRSLSGRLQAATIVMGTGHCQLAAERDYWDEHQSRYVCGYNPEGSADDCLVAGKILRRDGKCLGTLVNYACHPTTLAWDNQAISPDYVGAMREVLERETGAPCLFLQGASGDLGPRQGFVGDLAVADRNGRQLGYAAMSILESLPPPDAKYTYQGSVLSGTRIGTWKHEPLSTSELEDSSQFEVKRLLAELPYRYDMPSIDETRQQLTQWRKEELAADENGDEPQRAHCRAIAEQMQRQLWRQESLPEGKCFPMELHFLRIGNTRWLLAPGEHYQVLQRSLRERFPETLWVVATICNGWQPGYVPPASKYGYGIYQEQIAVVGPGSAEIVIETVARAT
jgi:hypothetical protein